MLVLDIDSTSTWNGVLVVFHVLVLFSSFKMASVNTGIDDWRQPRSDSETLLLSVSPYQDSRLLPLQLWLQPSEYYQHTSTRHLLPRGQEGNTHTHLIDLKAVEFVCFSVNVHCGEGHVLGVPAGHLKKIFIYL